MFNKIYRSLNPIRKNFNINGFKEDVLSLSELKLENVLKIMNNEIISVLGYGAQGKGQSLNLRDQGFNVILGLNKNGNSWKNALEDGWIENKNLFFYRRCRF